MCCVCGCTVRVVEKNIRIKKPESRIANQPTVMLEILQLPHELNITNMDMDMESYACRISGRAGREMWISSSLLMLLALICCLFLFTCSRRTVVVVRVGQSLLRRLAKIQPSLFILLEPLRVLHDPSRREDLEESDENDSEPPRGRDGDARWL